VGAIGTAIGAVCMGAYDNHKHERKLQVEKEINRDNMESNKLMVVLKKKI
jgi:hypothetical protein